jgi:hypothetical protein
MTSKLPAEPVAGRSGIDGNLIMGYSLLLTLVQIAVGIVHGIFRIALEWPIEPWDTLSLSASTALKLILLVTALFSVYWLMAHRHPSQFFANGVLVAAVTGLIGAVFGFVQAYDRLSGASMTVMFVAAPALHVALFLVVYFVLRSLAGPARESRLWASRNRHG